MGSRVGDVRGPASAEVVELHQVRQAFALPAAGRDAALAPAEDRVEVPGLQHALVWPLGHFFDPQWKRVEIQKAHAVDDHAA